MENIIFTVLGIAAVSLAAYGIYRYQTGKR